MLFPFFFFFAFTLSLCNCFFTPTVRVPTWTTMKIMVVTIVGGSSGAVSSLLLHKWQWGWWDIGATNNGILSGLVSVTAGCATLEPEAAFIVGVFGGCLYYVSSNFLLRLKVPKPLILSPCRGSVRLSMLDEVCSSSSRSLFFFVLRWFLIQNIVVLV